MEHIAAILLIVGCSPDLTQCRELPAPATIFETADDCASQQPFTLEDMRGRSPRVFATCIAVDPALEDDYNEIAWDVKPDGRLVASVEIIDDMTVASTELRPEKDYLSQE